MKHTMTALTLAFVIALYAPATSQAVPIELSVWVDFSEPGGSSLDSINITNTSTPVGVEGPLILSVSLDTSGSNGDAYFDTSEGFFTSGPAPDPSSYDFDNFLSSPSDGAQRLTMTFNVIYPGVWNANETLSVFVDLDDLGSGSGAYVSGNSFAGSSIDVTFVGGTQTNFPQTTLSGTFTKSGKRSASADLVGYPTTVPEPGAGLLTGAALIGILGYSWRKKTQRV